MSAVSAQDNQTVELNETHEEVTVNETLKADTTIKADSYTAYEGVKNTYKVELSSGNTKLSGKVIKFTLNGKTYNKKTNSKGVASLGIDLKKGKYDLQYSFEGDDNYKATAGAVKITVKKGIATKFKKVDPVIYRNKKTSKFKLKLSDANGNPVGSHKVVFKLNKKKYTKKTNSKGVVSVKIKLKTGNYKLKAIFQKTSIYKGKTTTYKIKVKPKQARNNGMWMFARDMPNTDFDTLKQYGTKHIFINEVAVDNYGKKYVENWIGDAKKHGIKVHIWMQVFYKSKTGWQNPVKNGKINYDLINSKVKIAKSYAKLKGVGGVHMDYIRYPGNAYKYKNAVKAINTFTKKAAAGIHKVGKKIIVSAAVMPEKSTMKKYYGQDIPTMSRYVDVIVPMVYKGNYNGNSEWIKKTTLMFKKQSKKAKIWTGIQGYKSDSKLVKLSPSELMGDADAAALGGAYGVMIFRYTLFNYINFNDV